MMPIKFVISDKKIKAAKKVIVSAFLALLFCLFFSHSTSPLFTVRMADSDMFALIGRGILEGKVPYIDLQENKGPLLFLLEAFPQWIFQGHTGIFFFQCILLSIDYYLLYLITIHFKLDKVCAFISEVAFTISLAITYTAGNMAEEYDVFFTIVGVYVFVDTFYNKKKKTLCGIILGLCTMSVLMIKMPDAAGLLVLDAAYVISPFIFNDSDKAKRCMQRIWSGFGGGILTLIAILVYYVMHGAVDDMLHGYFYINFMMTSMDFGLTRKGMLLSWYGLISILPVFISALSIGRVFKQGKTRLFLSLTILLFCLALCGVAYTHTTGYIQHLMPVSVAYLFSFCDYMSLSGNRPTEKTGITLLSYSLIAVYLLLFLNKNITANNYVNPIRTDFKLSSRSDSLFMDLIPDNQKNSVYRFGETENGWYYYNGIYPKYKWLNLRTLIRIGFDEVAEEFEKNMMNDPAEYLVYSGDIESYNDIFSNDLIEYISSRYTCIATEDKRFYNETVGLYKLTR